MELLTEYLIEAILLHIYITIIIDGRGQNVRCGGKCFRTNVKFPPSRKNMRVPSEFNNIINGMYRISIRQSQWQETDVKKPKTCPIRLNITLKGEMNSATQSFQINIEVCWVKGSSHRRHGIEYIQIKNRLFVAGLCELFAPVARQEKHYNEYCLRHAFKLIEVPNRKKNCLDTKFFYS